MVRQNLQIPEAMKVVCCISTFVAFLNTKSPNVLPIN